MNHVTKTLLWVICAVSVVSIFSATVITLNKKETKEVREAAPVVERVNTEDRVFIAKHHPDAVLRPYCRFGYQFLFITTSNRDVGISIIQVFDTDEKTGMSKPMKCVDYALAPSNRKDVKQ